MMDCIWIYSCKNKTVEGSIVTKKYFRMTICKEIIGRPDLLAGQRTNSDTSLENIQQTTQCKTIV